VLFQLDHQLADALLFNPVVTQTDPHLQTLEKGPRFFKGLVDPLRVVTIENPPNLLSLPRKLSSFLLHFNGQDRGQKDCQGLRMVKALHRRYFLTDHVGRPVLSLNPVTPAYYLSSCIILKAPDSAKCKIFTEPQQCPVRKLQLVFRSLKN
jgi:hypothetical protein